MYFMSTIFSGIPVILVIAKMLKGKTGMLTFKDVIVCGAIRVYSCLNHSVPGIQTTVTLNRRVTLAEDE